MSPVTDDAPTPRTPFEHHVHERIVSLEDSRRTMRWIVGLAAPAVIALLVWTLSELRASAADSGATRATLDGVKRSVDMIESKILKLSGTDPDPGVGVVAADAP